jgi:hypothetical protein
VGASDIVVFGSTFESSMNYAANTTGALCGFSSVFQNIQQFDSFLPDCFEATNDACVRDITVVPSVAPSERLTSLLSDGPSIFPTTRPETASNPTGLPSVDSSISLPEIDDTRSPTKAPLDFAWPDTSVPAAGNMLSGRFMITILGLALFLSHLFE